MLYRNDRTHNIAVILFTITINTTMPRLIMPDTSVRGGRLLRAVLLKMLKNSVLIVVRIIPESDIVEVLSTFDKNAPVLHGCFDEKRTVPMDVYSVISVRGETVPLALLNVADDFIKLGWIVASDGDFEQVEKSDGLIAAANKGLALSAPIDLTDPNQVPIWGDGNEDSTAIDQ